MTKFYKPNTNSKSHQAKLEKQVSLGIERVVCKKCNKGDCTLRKLPLRGETVYYCEDCIKKAIEGEEKC